MTISRIEDYWNNYNFQVLCRYDSQHANIVQLLVVQASHLFCLVFAFFIGGGFCLFVLINQLLNYS